MRVVSPLEHLEMWQRLLIMKMVGVRTMGWALSRRLFPQPDQEELRQTFVERWAENDKRAYEAALRALLGWSVEDRLGDIQPATLVVAADRDYWSLEVKKAYVAQIPDARLAVIEDARHAVAVEKPEEFNRALADFLASQE